MKAEIKKEVVISCLLLLIIIARFSEIAIKRPGLLLFGLLLSGLGVGVLRFVKKS